MTASAGSRGPKAISIVVAKPRIEGESVPTEPLPVNGHHHQSIEQCDTMDLAPLLREASNDDGVSPTPAPVTLASANLPASVKDLARALRVGAQYGAYVIERFIDRGGQAEVYAARHVGTGHPYAIKVLNILQAGEPTAVERFSQEGTLLLALRGVSGFVQAFEMFNFPNVGPVLVMELLRGMSVRKHLDKTPQFALDVVLAILKQSCRTLAMLHASGTVHRDLKPENMVLEPSPNATPRGKDGELKVDEIIREMRVVILDLGLAKVANGPVTTSSSIGGSCPYVCPEQLRQGEITPASDVYSLGLMGYEMAEGERGYEWKRRNPGVRADDPLWQLFACVKKPDHIPVSFWNRVISVCIQKTASRRFQDTLELLRAIDQWEKDWKSGRLTRDDFMPASLSPDAVPPPPPLPPEEGRVADSKPREIPSDFNATEPSLVVLEPTEFWGRRFAIGRTLTIGRCLPTDDPSEANADIAFALNMVSSRHCKLDIALEETAQCCYLVQDLNSRNGTYVDDVPVKDGLLRPGMILRIGTVRMQLVPPGNWRDQGEPARPTPEDLRERARQRTTVQLPDEAAQEDRRRVLEVAAAMSAPVAAIAAQPIREHSEPIPRVARASAALAVAAAPEGAVQSADTGASKGNFALKAWAFVVPLLLTVVVTAIVLMHYRLLPWQIRIESEGDPSHVGSPPQTDPAKTIVSPPTHTEAAIEPPPATATTTAEPTTSAPPPAALVAAPRPSVANTQLPPPQPVGVPPTGWAGPRAPTQQPAPTRVDPAPAAPAPSSNMFDPKRWK